MRYSCLILILFISFTTISCEEKALFEPLTEKEYFEMQTSDTIINLPKLLVTCTGNAGHYNDMETILVRKSIDDGVKYFELSHDVYFEDSSTLIEYQGFFSSDENGPFQKNGIWVYTDFIRNLLKAG